MEKMLIKYDGIDVNMNLNCYNSDEADKNIKETNAKPIYMGFDISGIK